jgi:hypothetical protein
MRRSASFFALTLGFIGITSGTALSRNFTSLPFATHFLSRSVAVSSTRLDGTEEVVEQRRVTKNFTAIEVNGGGITVEVVCKQEPKIEVIGEPEAVRFIETDISDGRLEISGAAWKSGKHAVVVRVSMQTLNSIDMSGANVMKASGISGDVLDVELSGTCVLEASGKVRKLMLEVSGASSVNVKDLIAEKVIVEVVGACKAVVYAEKYLSASACGVSKVIYFGEPKEISKDVSGLAKVSSMK